MTTEEPKVGAFIGSLKRNNKQIRDDRALAISEDTQMLYKRTIEDLDVKIRRMQREQENMLDLSAKDSTSLTLASDFNADEYVAKDVELAFKIKNDEIKLALAKERYEYLFGGM